MKVNIYIRTGDEVKNYESFNCEEKKNIDLLLNQQASRAVVIKQKTA